MSILKVVGIIALAFAYLFCAFLYGVAGPTANIEGGQNQQYWWEAPLWPIGILYRSVKSIWEDGL